jgi:serine/threonine-protein kinase RsbT
MTSTLEIPVADPSARTIVNIVGESDLLRVRSTMRAYARQAGLGLTATTKAVTASSELARNILRYATGGQGTAVIEEASSGQKRGVRVIFTDPGPGIADLDLAMRSGFSTGNSLGLGLPGSRRLVDDFYIDSAPGRGTRVVICQWDR